MTLLIDPPLLVSAGAVINRLAPDRRRARRLEGLTLAGFLGVGVPLYCNASWIDWFRRPFPAESGRDFMLNSLIFDFEHRRPGPAVHAVAAGVFATYPLWLRLGSRLGRPTAEGASSTVRGGRASTSSRPGGIAGHG